MVTVAKARFTGAQRRYHRRGSSGEDYVFPHRNRDDPWIGIEHVEDARRFERVAAIEVEWSARGQLLAYGADVLEKGYKVKRSLASDLGLEFDGQPDEETLDEGIQEHIDDLRQRGEL